MALREDPLYGRLPPGLEDDAMEFALKTGEAAADAMLRQYGRHPRQLADKLGVVVRESDERGQAGKTVFFSEYAERPPTITLYTRSFETVNRLVHENGLEGLLGADDVGPIHLAHELYHHLEAKKLTPGANRFRVTSHRLGPIKMETGLPSLSEIAADRFAQDLLGLPLAPKAFSFIIIYSHDPDYAWSLLRQMQALPA